MRALLNLADGATAACAAGDAFAASHAGSGEGSHAAATRSAAGFMTAADKAKLNAATAGATGSTLMARDAYGRAQVLHDRAARRQALPHESGRGSGMHGIGGLFRRDRRACVMRDSTAGLGTFAGAGFRERGPASVSRSGWSRGWELLVPDASDVVEVHRPVEPNACERACRSSTPLGNGRD